MPDPIALCVIARNEAQNLPRLLESVRDVVSEIVLVDTGSTDETAAIAKRAGARVVAHPWQESFALARNAGLAEVRSPWVLILDADEALHPDDRPLLRALPDSLTGVEGCFLRVISFVGAAPGPDQVHDCRLSLFRNRPEYRFQGAIHEQILPSIYAADARAVITVAPIRILHYGYLSTGTKSGKRERNLSILQAALTREPDEPFWHYAIAAEWMGEGDFAQALEHLAVAARLWSPAFPHHSDVVRKQIICLTELQRMDGAVDLARAGLQLHPAYTDLAFLAGVAELRRHQAAAAREWFARCLELGEAPYRYQSWSGVGGFRSLAALGALAEQPQEAAAYFRAALMEAPDWQSAQVGLAGALAQMPLEQAQAWVAERLDCTHAPTMLALGNALLQARGAALLHRLVRPRSSPAHFLLAAALCLHQAAAVRAE